MTGWVCVGIVVGAHGVQGRVRIRSFTANPTDVGAYGPLHDDTGRHRFTARVAGVRKENVVLADLTGIVGRSQAEALRGRRLFVPRSALPELEEDTFHWADLIGLAVVRADGTPAGEVVAVHDFGAGSMLEVAVGERRTVMVSFTRAMVPEVDITGGRVVVATDGFGAVRAAAGSRTEAESRIGEGA